MLIVLTWYLALQLFAFAAWPLLFGVCDRLYDRGYAMSKAMGLILVTYLTWAVAHMGGRIPALGFSFSTVSAAWFIVLVISLVGVARRGGSMAHFFRRNLAYVLTAEALLLAGFSAYVGLKAIIPHISYNVAKPTVASLVDHAAEKFTDFAVLNSLLTSSAFPPHDAWVSGDTLNYYYFGHMLWATMIKFCSVRPEIGFNLALASAFGLALVVAFGVGYNLTRRLRWGAFLAFLVVLCSNLDGFWQLFTTLKLTLIDSRGQDLWYIDHPWWKNYEFWRSSRAIQNTINEFPAFSFILGDLHAHLSGLVISLCGWNLAVQMWRSVRRYASLWSYEKHALDELFLAALICGALSATNSWDVPLMAGVYALALYCGFTGRRDPYGWNSAASVLGWRALEAVESLFIAGLAAVIGVAGLFFPFVINFRPPQPAEGHMIKIVAPENHSSPFEFIAHWLLLAGVPMLLVWGVLVRRRRLARALDVNPAPAGVRRLALLLLAAAACIIAIPLFGGWVGTLTLLAAIILGAALLHHNLPPMARWVLGLMLLFCVLTCFCELFYLDDIFSGPIERINTVFKVYFGLWTLCAVATLMAVRLLIHYGSHHRRRALWLVLPIIILGSPYAILGTLNRIDSSTRLGHWSKPEDSPQTEPPAPMLRPEARPRNLEEALDGLRYMQYLHPDDYAAILWTRTNVPTTATLLEAAGTQYSYSGRFSTLTGRPAFGGWLAHAWGWRGKPFEAEYTRRLDVASDIYTTSSLSGTVKLLKQEGIDYVVIGDQEREQYPGIQEQKFTVLGTPVFTHGSTVIYKVRPDNETQGAPTAPLQP